MTVRPIRIWPDPVLSQPARPVTAFGDDLRQLACDMLETMYDAPGRGLAAPQVGVLERIFVLDTDWKEGDRNPRVFVNPVLSDPSDDTAPLHEGCLSLPGFTAEVMRPAEITIDWQDLDGTAHRERLTGFAARAAQHEADHLDGTLTLDRIDEAELARIDPALAVLRGA